MRNYDNSSAGLSEINENLRGTHEEGVKKGMRDLPRNRYSDRRGRDRLIVTNTDPGLPNYKLMSRGNFEITFFPSTRSYDSRIFESLGL